MVDQGQRAEPAQQLTVGRSDQRHAVCHSVAAVVETFGGELVLAAAVDQFGRTDLQVPGVEETVDLYEILVVAYFGGLGQVRHQKLIFELL